MNKTAFFRTFLKREIFSRRTYAFQVILSVAIGVGAVSGIQSYKTSLTSAIRVEAKNLMGADLGLQGQEKFTESDYEFIQSRLPEGSKTGEVVQFLSMVRNPKNEEVSLSLIRAMDDSFPLFGALKTDPPSAYSNLTEKDVLLEENLAKNLKLSPGDPVQIGNNILEFRGILLQEPGSLGGFTGMAPTSVIRRLALEGSGLEQRGSRIRYTFFVRLPENTDSLVFKENNFSEFLEKDITIYHNTEVNSGSQIFITNTLDFLSLLGLASFFLGAVAIFISTRTRVMDSKSQISILKCLGLDGKYIKILVISETLVLSLLGSILGLGMGFWIQESLPGLLVGIEAEGISQGLTRVSILEGIGLGLVIPLLVSIHSLIQVGKISPLVALKNPEGVASDNSNPGKKLGFTEGLLLLAVFFFFWLIAFLDTGSIGKGLILCSVFLVLPITIWILYLGLRFVLNAISKIWEFPRGLSIVFKKFVRQYGLVSLSIIGLGSAIFVLLLSLVLRESLLNLGGARQVEKRPNVFILDIRNEQMQGFRDIIEKYPIEEYRRAPVLRARLSKINGEKIDKSKMELDAKKRDWRSSARTREYMLSYRDELYDTETVASGEFWKPGTKNEISVEKEFSKYLGAGIGDELEFKLEGFPLDRAIGKITNLRSVNWSDMKPNFVVLFSGGNIEEVPGFFLSSLYLESSEDRFRLQKELVKNYPNITFIDTEKAVRSFENIVEKVSAIINVMSSLLVFASVLLLVSVLYSSSNDRLRELVFFRILGARKKFIRNLIFLEAGFIAFLSFSTGFLLAMIADGILNRYVLELTSIYPWENIGWVALFVYVSISIAYWTTSLNLFHRPVKELMKD